MTVTWPTCEVDDCIGVRIEGEHCIRHASQTDLKFALSHVATSRELTLFRGVEVNHGLFMAVCSRLPGTDDGGRIVPLGSFNHTRFVDEIDFSGFVFQGRADFSDAHFASNARFTNAQFEGDALFRRTTFVDRASFENVGIAGKAFFPGTTFESNATFDYASIAGDAFFVRHHDDQPHDVVFVGPASFAEVTFGGRAHFTGATFLSSARFGLARFSRRANFGNVRFNSSGEFRAAAFSDAAVFSDIQVGYRLSFDRARFDDELFTRNLKARSVDLARAWLPSARAIGPLSADTEVILSRAHFGAPVRIDIETPHLDCTDVTFSGGGLVRTTAEVVDLAGAQFLRPTIVTGSSDHRPVVESVVAADVSGLVLSSVDLSACRFVGGHNLDKLRIEGETGFRRPPRFRGRRRILFEERLQRRWIVKEPTLPCPTAHEIAEAYRSLRKGRENRADAPGAADFYYGEMEMRRRAKSSWSERLILTLYWLVSGYGLRTSRALTAFALIMIGATALFQAVDSTTAADPSWRTAAVMTLTAATAIPVNTDALTETGTLIRIVVRVVAPIFLALAVLSLRSRVRRQ